MNKLILFSLLGALTLTTTAQSAQDESTVTITQPKYTITLPEQSYRMTADEFNEYKGAYDLSNGMTLSVFKRGQTMYARIDDQDSHIIVATAADTFVARDKQLKMRIENHSNGEVSGEVYMVVPSDTQAKGGASQVIMVAFH